MKDSKAIGIFDSGFGGLTVFKSIYKQLPDYDYIFTLGDTARAPYGNRTFQSIHEYTWECVQWLFQQGCELVVLACNTASARALRTIQQNDLQNYKSAKRVLGVIRPTAEVIGNYTLTNNIGVLGTKGTVASGSYQIEIGHFFPAIKVYQQACPLWVPLIENGELDNTGTDYFIKKYLDQLLAQSPDIDTVLLACTHYPLLIDKINIYLKGRINVVPQGEIVAESLVDYLQRHQEIDTILSRCGTQKFYTTSDDTLDFDHYAKLFFGASVTSAFADVNADL